MREKIYIVLNLGQTYRYYSQQISREILDKRYDEDLNSEDRKDNKNNQHLFSHTCLIIVNSWVNGLSLG